MTVFDWLICLLMGAGALLNVRDVGKPRDPITPGLAALVVLINFAIILGIVLDW